MAVSALPNGGQPANGSLLETVDQLKLYVTDFQKYIDLKLLVPKLVEHKIITDEEKHDLTYEGSPPQTRILNLVTEILPRKESNILQLFKRALEDTLQKNGSSGHRALLENFFGLPPKVHSSLDTDLTTADTVSDESEEFSILLMKFRKCLENGTERAVAQRLKDVANFLYHLKKRDHSFLLDESARDKLDSDDLTFSKLLNCLDSSDPPVISHNDVSILHKIVDRVLQEDEGSNKIIKALKALLEKYEQSAGIAVTEKNPQVPTGSARITSRVLNAHRGNPQLKNGVRKSFFQSLFKFRGSDIGSVIFYWDIPEEYTQQLIESFENSCRKNIELYQLKIIRVEAQVVKKPYQINLDMEITDPVLLQASQKQHTIADDIAPEQENLTLFLLKIDHLIGGYVELFLSTSRKEHSRPYAQFEQTSFKEMTGILISEDKLHCCDISYIQQFLLSLLKWDTSQGSQYKEQIIALLNEAQDYEPVSTGSPLPSVRLCSKSHVTIITHFRNISIHCVSYEVMMAIKYALMQLLHLSLSAFQYVGNKKEDHNCCQITWKTGSENFEKIENKIRYHPSAAALAVDNDYFNYPNITLSCSIKNPQILLDGSPLLCPDIDGKVFYFEYALKPY